jgi:hypothetical protein
LILYLKRLTESIEYRVVRRGDKVFKVLKGFKDDNGLKEALLAYYPN